MLKKLQRKIVFMNMLLVGIVLLVVFSFFCYSTYRVERATVQAELSRTLSLWAEQDSRMTEQGQPFPGSIPYVDDDDDDDDDDDGFGTRNGAGFPGSAQEGDMQVFGLGIIFRPETPSDTLILRQDPGGSYTVLTAQDIDLSGEEMQAAAGAALKGADMGALPGHGLYYKVATVRGTTYLAFADASHVHEETREVILTSTILWLVLMLLFALISLIMAHMAVRPVKESWDRQQEFVADASHELKTPLTVILANNNILLAPDRAMNEEDRKWVESTQEEATHMKTLVDHLLYLARSDSGDQKILLEDLNLSDMVEEDALQFEPVAFDRGITMNTEIENDVHITGDGTMIKQLIHILLDNACKYAARDGAIHVALKSEGPRAGIALSVQNDGEPIPAADLPHLFERFYRSDKARTYSESTSGYGLGLSIAQSIAEDHGGTIRCTSTEEDGTTFTVRFRKR